ncbi:AraC family transcriptional regulator [Saccharothrix mutabilis subsp. mutabilis]|uniref:AraC family transcriptional regulator n=1 Tax=Saccharothrix mutabilis subsp. mutabilis TaxID=66855 RepID=A0ABN0UP06_9PSEU
MSSFAEPAVRHWDFPRGIAGVALLLRFGAEHGVPAPDLLAGSGITPARLADPTAEVDADQELRVVRNLAAHLPNAGVEVGTRYHATTFGVLGFAFLSAATVQDAVDTALRYLDLSFAFTAPTAALEHDHLVIGLHPRSLPADVSTFLVERDLAAIHTVINELAPGGAPTLSVAFTHQPPADTRPHHDTFGVHPTFATHHNRLVVDATVLRRTLPLANPETTAACEQQCRTLATRRRDRQGVTSAVRDLLRHSERFTEPMSTVARSLGLSTRTLRRRLAESGTTYQILLDQARAERATALLDQHRWSVEQIATRLGFAEAASFIHAFRRWHGTTPGDYARSRR